MNETEYDVKLHLWRKVRFIRDYQRSMHRTQAGQTDEATGNQRQRWETDYED